MADLPSTTAAPAASDAPAKPVRTGLRLLLPLALVLLLVALLVGTLAGGGRWLLLSEDGARWLVARLPGVQVQGLRGALLGDQLRADKLRIEWAGGTKSLLITDLRADGLIWQWRPHTGIWAALQAQRLQARRVELNTGPPSGPPKSLLLPLQLQVAQVQMDEMVVNASMPVQGLALRGVVVDGRSGQLHAVEEFALVWQGNAVQGQAQISNSAPLTVAAQASLRPTAGGEQPAWGAAVRANGPLENLAVQATLRGVPLTVGSGKSAVTRAAPAFDLKASVQPYAAWPLAALSASTQGLDLAALSPLAPETSLSGTAQIQSSALNAPVSARLQLENSRPGRWNERRLPVRRIELDVSGLAATPAGTEARVDATRFELQMADGAGAAGRWSGSAVWLGPTLTVSTLLTDVKPQHLDGRAAAMTLSGPLSATVRGLPAPGPQAPAAAPTAPTARAAAKAPGLSIDWKLQLDGRLDAAPQPVRLSMQASADAQHVQVRQLRAEAGPASADLSATVTRLASQQWAISSSGKLNNFDPLPWWPGEASSAWRQGPHRLSADWQLAVTAPAQAAALAPLDLLQSLAGEGRLNLRDSVLAGVPLTADVTLGAPSREKSTLPLAKLRAELNLGGNQLLLEGLGDPTGNGQADHWLADINAQALASLAPLARLNPALGNWVPRQGSMRAKLTADGRWPLLRSSGQASVLQLQMGTLALQKAEANWQLDSGGAQNLALTAQASGLQLGSQRVEQLQGDVRGTLAEHRINISAALPGAPPAAASQLLGMQTSVPARSSPGTRVQMLALGAWAADAAGGPGLSGGGRWRAKVERLTASAWGGAAADSAEVSKDSGPNSSAPKPWAEARDLRAELQFDARGKLLNLQAEAGSARLGDAVNLRWDAVRIGLGGALPQIELRAQIDPINVAPLLARWQPGMGWAGDLRLAGRIDIRATERFDADVVFERQDGDLNMSSGDGSQLLGLSQLRLVLAAHDGVWSFSQALKGRSLGEITGNVRVRSTAQARWPAADAPIDGSIQAQVADIGIWSNWVPAGWRLTGEVRTTAALSGTFGAPKYTGDVNGSGLGVRNLLQGVNVNDGRILVRLAGDVAQIERFTLRGGEGTLSVTGGASFGTTPSAKLALKAERFRVLGRVDRQLTVSGNAELFLQTDQIKLDGSVFIDEGLFDASRADAPSLDDDVSVKRAGTDDGPALDANANRVRRNVAVGLDIDLGEKMLVRGRGLDTTLRGKLRLSTPGGRLSLAGTINASGGTYKAYGQKLEIERGTLAFSGPPDNPRLDVLALRPNIDNRVGVAISGNLLTTRVRLFSEPEMSDNEKLSWLVLGRAPDGLGRADTALLQRAAVALLAGEGEAPTDALMRSLGIDDVSLRQSDGEVRETVITLGKQLSRRWYLGYERGVNATTGTWQLIYRIAQRFTLRAQSGLENSLDIIWVNRVGESTEAPDAAAGGVRKSVTLPP